MLIRTIARLRRLPKTTRNYIAVAASGSFTTAVVLIWLVSNTSGLAQDEQVATAGGGVAPLFSVFLAGLQEQVRNFRDLSTTTETAISDNTSAVMPATVVPSESTPSIAVEVAPAATPTSTATGTGSVAPVPIRIATTSVRTTVEESVE